MKRSLKSNLSRGIIGALALVVALPLSAQVLPTARREADLEKARAALARKTAPQALRDPFHSETFKELMGLNEKPVVATDARPAGPRNNRELLETIAMGLKTSGVLVANNGERNLVFGQKRVKAGGLLTITFDGTEYTLEVTAIEPPNFTLRLNRDVFTRPIK